jgi:TRAP-type uncharacterized transport system substrate-binding protein
MNLDNLGRWAWWIAAAITLIVIGTSSAVLFRPLPPRHFVLATGPAESPYEETGKRYRDLLAKEGIRVELRQTAGAVANLALLNDPHSGVSAGFVQSGTTSAAASPDLVSLGAVFEESLWFFCRCEASDLAFQGMNGRKVSIGPEGSGTRSLALKLIAMNGMDPARMTLLDLSPDEGTQRLLDGSIDAVAIQTTWGSPALTRLFGSAEIHLVGFPRADAYVALLPYLDKITVPMGVGNLGLNRPDRDVTIVGSKASLAVRKSLHPALQYLLIRAAQETGGQRTAFTAVGSFPSALAIDLPLSEEAGSFYKSGPTMFQRHLPFWLAELISRLVVGLLPIFGVLYPMWSLVPEAYNWFMRQRIDQHYHELKELEHEVGRVAAGVKRPDLLQRIEVLEQRVTELRVPTAFASAKYQLKAHVDLVSRALLKRLAP